MTRVQGRVKEDEAGGGGPGGRWRSLHPRGGGRRPPSEMAADLERMARLQCKGWAELSILPAPLCLLGSFKATASRFCS